MGRSFLVTGGAGFIGSNLVHHLLSLPGFDGRVVVLDRLTYAGNLDNLESCKGDPRFHFVHGDICDRALVNDTFAKHQPNVVFNLAAESHVDRSIDGPGEFIRTNVVGTFELLEASRVVHAKLADFRFVHVSTDEVFGSLGPQGYFTETTPYDPRSPYSASKASADHLANAYFHTYGLPTVTTNCSNNYGPYQFPEKLIPLVTLNALEGKPLPVYGDGKNIRDWLYVEDHCQALALVADKGIPGESYAIGGHNERTNIEIVETICAILDELSPTKSGKKHREQITFVKDRPGHDRRYAIDPTKIGKALGWKPDTKFDDGIRRTIAWYLEHREWCDRIAQGKYRRERLGLSGGST